MLDGLRRLRHDAIVGGHYEHDHVGNPSPAGPHLGESLVTRRIDKGDLLPSVLDLVGRDVLGDAAGLP